jgi:hypothetical protein
MFSIELGAGERAPVIGTPQSCCNESASGHLRDDIGFKPPGTSFWICSSWVLDEENLPRASNLPKSIAKCSRTISISCNYPGRGSILLNRKLCRPLISFDLTIFVRGGLATVGSPVQTNVDAQRGVIEIAGKRMIKSVNRVRDGPCRATSNRCETITPGKGTPFCAANNPCGWSVQSESELRRVAKMIV